MKEYLMLCKKKAKDNDGKTFYVWFAYRQFINDKGEFEDRQTEITDNDGNKKLIAKSIKVALADKLKKRLDEEDKYPYRLTLNDELLLNDGRKSYYVTINKDKDGKFRLDKNGRKHAIIVIREVEAYEPIPLKSLSLNDIDDIA